MAVAYYVITIFLDAAVRSPRESRLETFSTATATVLIVLYAVTILVVEDLVGLPIMS